MYLACVDDHLGYFELLALLDNCNKQLVYIWYFYARPSFRKNSWKENFLVKEYIVMFFNLSK